MEISRLGTFSLHGSWGQSSCSPGTLYPNSVMMEHSPVSSVSSSSSSPPASSLFLHDTQYHSLSLAMMPQPPYSGETSDFQHQPLDCGNGSFSQFIYASHTNSVARRNERERNRVRFINYNFIKLQQHLPCSEKKKKLSKVETLRTAIRYIKHLQHILKVQEKAEKEDGDDDILANDTVSGGDLADSDSNRLCKGNSETNTGPVSTGKSESSTDSDTVTICGDFNDSDLHDSYSSCSEDVEGDNWV